MNVSIKYMMYGAIGGAIGAVTPVIGLHVLDKLEEASPQEIIIAKPVAVLPGRPITLKIDGKVFECYEPK